MTRRLSMLAMSLLAMTSMAMAQTPESTWQHSPPPHSELHSAGSESTLHSKGPESSTTATGKADSTWQHSPQPHSELRSAGSESTLHSKGPESSTTTSGTSNSTFASSPVPESTFELKGVAESDLAATRKMLTELHARPAAGGIVVDLPGDVLFDFDQDTLRGDAMPTLEKVAALLAKLPRAAVAIHGHTDSRGEDAYNDDLSRRRAASVQAWLVARDGASGRAFDARGFGERRPVAPNTKRNGRDDPVGRQKNRRVEIVIRPAV